MTSIIFFLGRSSQPAFAALQSRQNMAECGGYRLRLKN
jgi:hypothetical protein